jgi:hypothetical protein
MVRKRLAILAILLLAALIAPSCGLEQPILNQVTEWGPDWVPEAPEPYLVRGQVYGFPGGTVDFYSATGAHLPAYAAEIQPNGIFDAEFPGTTDYRNLVLVAGSGPQRLLGLATRIPRNRDIYYDPDLYSPIYHLGGMTWGDAAGVMTNLDDRTTTMTLIMLRAAANLGTAGVDSTNTVLASLSGAIKSKTGPVYTFHRMVQRVLAAAARDVTYPVPIRFPDAHKVFLAADFLAAARIDYTGDGLVDLSTAAFDGALAGAAEEILISGCASGGRMTVVFMADLNEGNRDLNCGMVAPFKHATNDEGKTLYITGGMFTSDPSAQTPVCDSDGKKEAGCLTPSEWAEVNTKLGNWTPNTVPLRDDGEAGDNAAGDNVWTAVFELPYIPTNGKDKGVRVGYKYTYGYKGQGWTSSEEWPGNNRILEIEDGNGDGLLVRYDYFGDETSNKNVANLNNGLCGSTRNPWPEEVAPGCFADTGENEIDGNGDCVPDHWPVAGSVVPQCIEANVPGIAAIKDNDYKGAGASPTIQGVGPASGPNGGGFLVELFGTSFKPQPGSDIEVNSAADATITQNRLAGYLVPDPNRVLFSAPAFLATKANVVVLGGAATAKAELNYTVAGTVPCSLVYPQEMPSGDGVAGAADVGEPTFPILARLALAEAPGFNAGLRVEVGLSPACCYEDDSCAFGVQSCLDLPRPEWQEGWSWFPMDHDADCMVPEDGVVAECDEGTVQFIGRPVPGMGPARYRYLVRYSFDSGRSWDFCDAADDEVQWGNENGIKLIDAGMMWVD